MCPTRSMLGRVNLVRDISAELSPGSVISLVGPAGVGKTTLALHVASGLRQQYRDGVWLCELADIVAGDSIVDAVATTLGVRQQRGKTMLASIVSAFLDAEALLVLDNCEHVRTSAGQLIGLLQRDCPRLTVLATSREPLDISGERVRHVEPLPLPGPDTADGPAPELFLTRARENGVSIELDPPTEVAVIEICRRLDGLPLAIELAAARARTMSVTEMSVRLDERLRLLTSTRADAPRRQRTLRDAVDWSYQLLDADEQELFDRLSVFLGGFTAEAAAAISGVSVGSVEQQIWALVDRSLVTFSMVDVSSRYQLLETLRHYGLEHLEQTGSLTRTKNAHMRYFVELASAAGAGIARARRGPTRQAAYERAREHPGGASARRRRISSASRLPSWWSRSTSTPSGGSSSSSAPGHAPSLTSRSEQPTLCRLSTPSRDGADASQATSQLRPNTPIEGSPRKPSGVASAGGSTTSSPTAPTSRGTPTRGWHTATPRSRSAGRRGPVPPQLCARRQRHARGIAREHPARERAHR